MTPEKTTPASINLSMASKISSLAEVAELQENGAIFNEPAKALLRKRGYMPPERLSRKQREHIATMAKSFMSWHPFKKAVHFIWQNICAMFPSWLRDEALRFACVLRPYEHKSLSA